MSRVDKGAALTSATMQPDRTIVEKNDGTLEGNVTYKVDVDSILDLPDLNDTHPDDDRLECYNITKTYNSNGVVTATCSYFGLTNSPTDRVVSYSGGQNNDPIETHPNFEDFAGTKDAPLNGATFDADTGLFTGFEKNTTLEIDENFQGVEYYLTPATLVTVSYWTDRAPNLDKRLTITKKLKGVGNNEFNKPPDVKNFLLLDSPYRQVGNFFQVTEQYMGSGENGWNEEIYQGSTIG